MRLRGWLAGLAALTLLFGAMAEAQIGTGGVGPRPGIRNKGGVGGGDEPAVFQVVSVDTSGRVLLLRAADGSTANVKVPEGVYDLSKLNTGDRIQVNFYVPDSMNPGLRAAGIWPAQ
jgi:hypothetical protein